MVNVRMFIIKDIIKKQTLYTNTCEHYIVLSILVAQSAGVAPRYNLHCRTNGINFQCLAMAVKVKHTRHPANIETSALLSRDNWQFPICHMIF